MAGIVKLPPTPRHPKPAGRSAIGTVPPSAPPASTPPRPRLVRPSEHSSEEITSHTPTNSHPPTPRCCSASRSSPSGGRLAAPPTPRPAEGTSSELSARILPRFGNLALAQLDTHVVAIRRHDLTREGLSSRTIATYLWLLGTVCNAAVGDGYLDRSRLSATGRRLPATLTATAAEPSLPRMIWPTRPQVHQLADAARAGLRSLSSGRPPAAAPHASSVPPAARRSGARAGTTGRRP
jgi:hypothetical protein